MTREQLIAKLEEDLNWKGQNGKVAGHVLFKRAEAEALIRELRRSESQSARITQLGYSE